VLLQFDTGGTTDTDQSEYAGYIDVEMVAQRTTSGYSTEIFTARLNYILAWNEQSDAWQFETFVQENKSVSAYVPDAYTIFKSVPVFKYKYVDRQLQIYVSFNANYFRGYTSFTARVTSDAPADVSMPGSDALMASGTVGTAEIGMCYGIGANAAYVGIGTTNPIYKLDVRGDAYIGNSNVFMSGYDEGPTNNIEYSQYVGKRYSGRILAGMEIENVRTNSAGTAITIDGQYGQKLHFRAHDWGLYGGLASDRAMTIAGPNVGIGTNSPATYLHLSAKNSDPGATEDDFSGTHNLTVVMLMLSLLVSN
jgi:hypothetical protein